MSRWLADYAAVLGGSVISRGAAFLATVLVARGLGPETFGRFTLFNAVMILTWQFPTAFDTTYVRYARASDDPAMKIACLRVSLAFKLVYLLVLLAASVPLARFIATRLFNKPDAQPLLIAGFAAGMGLVFLMSIASRFQERDRFFSFSVIHASYTVVILVALGALLRFRDLFTLTTVVGVYLATTLAVGAVSLILILRQTGWQFTLDRPLVMKLFAFGGWLFGAGALNCLFLRVDTLFLSGSLSFDEVGVYGAAAQLILVVSLATGSIGAVLTPRASVALLSPVSFRRYLRESVIAAVAVGGGIIPIIVFTGTIVHWCFGPEYLAAVPVGRLMLTGWLIWSLYQPFSYLFQSLEATGALFLLELSRIAVALVLLALFVPRWGLMGAAGAMAGALVFQSLAGGAMLVRRFAGNVTFSG